jgi:chemotaxis-related protein WspB
MLMLLFQAGNRQYALSSQDVSEVLPWATLYPLPQAPAAIAGLLNYHGQLISVLDLGQLIHNTPSRPHFGARILIIKAKTANIPGFENCEWLGLLADRVVDTLQVQPHMLEPITNRMEHAPYLGAAIIHEHQIIRCFQPKGIDLSATASPI